MISKNTIKLIKSLAQKKYRLKENLFLIEGDKTVAEVLQSTVEIEKIFATADFIKQQNLQKLTNRFVEVDYADIRKASLLKNPQQSLALCRIPEKIPVPEKLNSGLSIFLDDIQDPGNLGTIIRICDWFGVEHLFCSENTADVYNPKVIQASMGSFARVKTTYTEFGPLRKIASDSGTKIFGTFLSGTSIYAEKLPENALVVLGNEGNGIQHSIEEQTDVKIKIPDFSPDKAAESLNVSVAAAIVCSEFKRQNLF